MAGGRAQKNKEHKTRFASKSSRQKYKLGKETVPGSVKGKQVGHGVLGKAQRLLRTKQIRENKRAEVLAEKRLAGGASAPPRFVVLVSLSSQVDLSTLKSTLLSACEPSDSQTKLTNGNAASDVVMGDIEGSIEKNRGTGSMVEGCTGGTTVAVPRYKMRLTVLTVDCNNVLASLEAVKVADVVIVAVPAVVSTGGQSSGCHIDEAGKVFLSIVQAQGLPSVVGVIQGLTAVPPKRQLETKKSANGALTAQFSDDCKIFSIDSSEDCQPLLRHLSEQRLTPPAWRTQRPYIAAHEVDFAENPSTPGIGSLRVSGYLRGRGISVNQPVHVVGFGDFQLAQIDGPDDPCPFHIRQKRNAVTEMDGVEKTMAILGTADPKIQEPIVVENTPDPLAGEQTWPTEGEMDEARQKRRVRKKVPKGTSAYQAAWYTGDSEEEGEEGEDEEEDGEGDEAMVGEKETNGDGREASNDGMEGDEEDEGERERGIEDSEDEWEELEEEKGKGGASRATSVWGEDHADLMEVDDGMTSAQREADRQRLKTAHQDDQEFPDEVDTPLEIPARQRFAKYRGLKSFRSSVWDPYESLPAEYSRIFEFENFKRTQKHALLRATEVDKGSVEGSASVGIFIRLQISNVSQGAAEKIILSARDLPLVVFGLLQHETKMSVLHFSVKKTESYKEPVKSKDELVFHCGFRKFLTRPIFSTDDLNLDKHKFERFLHPGRFSIASIFAPVSFPPLPLLVFKEENGKLNLVASGSLREANPDRIILKKIVLSGYPLSVSKRKAVVKYMFHNAEDVRWFQPVELYTKYGRRGRIREPVGEKGNMKCMFDGVLQQRDAVCLSLYKRVYPKWPKPVE